MNPAEKNDLICSFPKTLKGTNRSGGGFFVALAEGFGLEEKNKFIYMLDPQIYIKKIIIIIMKIQYFLLFIRVF